VSRAAACRRAGAPRHGGTGDGRPGGRGAWFRSRWRRAVPHAALLLAACRAPAASPAAEDLRPLVDSLLPVLERISGLPALAPVRLERRSREEARRYVIHRLDAELPPHELERMHDAYAAFGLLPDTLDLRELLLDVYTEQVIGYYDPEERVLVVVAGVPRDALATVIAHELVHALQDQHFGLESVMRQGAHRGDDRDNDRQTAAAAAIEGHATLSMILLAVEGRLGRPAAAAELPDVAAEFRAARAAGGEEEFPSLRRAPAVLRESLLFPYFAGAGFVQALWIAAERRGEARPPPFGERLPRSSAEVIHPEERFLRRRLEPVTPALAGPPAGWRTLYEDNLGELETGILLREHLGPGADAAARGWVGDRYRLIEGAAGERVLQWVTVWADTVAADAFAEAYRAVLRRRDRAGDAGRMQLDGRPAVVVTDAPAGTDLAAVPAPVAGMPAR
jgi:hypothetical protein